MKTQYETVFAAHVAAALQKATELGIKATWSTAKHLDALAETIEKNDDVRDVLKECYNVSAYQQLLAAKFAKSGHFQREGKKSTAERLDSVLDKLAAEAMG